MAKPSPVSRELVVFLSSTYADLQPHRAKVEEALARIQTGFRSMKFFGSKEGDPLEQCLSKVRDCNYYVCFVGHRYGTVHAILAKSYTELEYEEAKKLGISMPNATPITVIAAPPSAGSARNRRIVRTISAPSAT